MIAPSGQQFELRYGEQHATIVEVGGGIREYCVGDRDVLHPYPVDAMCDGAHGAPLIPWPNRLADGRYRFDDVDYQVALTEPDKQNAIHGLLRWRTWHVVERSENRIVMATRLHPIEGYPFLLETEIEYLLDEAGLTVRTATLNAGNRPCPYGCGQHPYLSPGSGTIDDCALRFAARTRIVTDPERKLPTGAEPVEGTSFDFRVGCQIGDLQVDFAFTDLERDHEGRAWVSLGAPDGETVELWADLSYPVLEIFTADTLAVHRRRCGLGVEPMTCPPNAFQTGREVIRLGPGESKVTSWGARLAP